MSRPLWRLLLATAVSSSQTSLTCADCFTILEYLADIGPHHNDWPTFIKKARQHMVSCPNCQAYYQKRLDELEALEATD